jgi:hypothetical protein
MSEPVIRTVAVILMPALVAGGMIAFNLWAGPAAKAPALPQPERESLDSLIKRLNPPGRGSEAEWKAWMRCIDQQITCDMILRNAEKRKRELDRLKMRPLDPTGNRVVPRPRWDWKQT